MFHRVGGQALPPYFRTWLSRGVSALLGPRVQGPFLGPSWPYSKSQGQRPAYGRCAVNICGMSRHAGILSLFPPVVEIQVTSRGRATAGLPSPESQLTVSPLNGSCLNHILWHLIIYGFILLHDHFLCFVSPPKIQATRGQGIHVYTGLCLRTSLFIQYNNLYRVGLFLPIE